MGYTDYFFLGKIFRTHGIKGHLILYLHPSQEVRDQGRGINFKKVKSLFVEIENNLKEFKLKEITVTPPNVRFSLDEIDTMTKAETLLKKDVYLPIGVLPKRKKNDFYFEDLINAKVIDTENGELGLIQQILNYPQQTLAQVIYNGSEILFPLNENFIERFSKEENTLYVNLPEGLIELYTEKKV